MKNQNSDKLKIGDRAPEFSLSDQEGSKRNLRDYRSQWLLLYFYPKDDTSGCTKEACAVRDNFPDFQMLKLQVLGISGDSIESHKKFAAKYRLPFPLLSDEKKETVTRYGVWGKKKFMGRQYMGIFRTSFLIDPQGKIAKIYLNVKPESHIQEVLEDLKELTR